MLLDDLKNEIEIFCNDLDKEKDNYILLELTDIADREFNYEEDVFLKMFKLNDNIEELIEYMEYCGYQDLIPIMLFIGNEKHFIQNKNNINKRINTLIELYEEEATVNEEYVEDKGIEIKSYYIGTRVEDDNYIYHIFNHIDKQIKNEKRFTNVEIENMFEKYFNNCTLQINDNYGIYDYWDDNESEYSDCSSYEDTSLIVSGSLINEKHMDDEHKNKVKDKIYEKFNSFMGKIYNKETFLDFYNNWLSFSIGHCYNKNGSIEECIESILNYKHENYITSCIRCEDDIEDDGDNPFMDIDNDDKW